jgi:hypothetical protein
MAYRHFPLHLSKSTVVENIAYQPHAFAGAGFLTVPDRNPGAFLPAMLQGKQPEMGYSGYLSFGGDNTKNAALIARLIVVDRPMLDVIIQK